jgi:hypothetical protein
MSQNVSPAAQNKDGQMIGWLSIGAGASAAVVNPLVAVAGFFLAMVGLTLAAPKQRIWSILGIVASIAGFAVGKLTGIALL